MTSSRSIGILVDDWSVIRQELAAQLQHGSDEFAFLKPVLQRIRECVAVPSPQVSDDVVHVVRMIQEVLVDDRVPQEIQKLTADVLELWCWKKLVSTQVLRNAVFRYQLTNVVLRGGQVSRINQLSNYCRLVLGSDGQNEALDWLVPLVPKLVEHEQILALTSGRNMVAFCVVSDVALVEEFHRCVKSAMPECDKKRIAAYSDIYCRIIKTASAPVRDMLASTCLKDVVTHILCAQRRGVQVCSLGQQLLEMWLHLHQKRHHVVVRRTLMETCEPLLWRHVTSSNNVHRCNSAELLIHMYPLEDPSGHCVDNSNLLERQHATLKRLLTDPCHVARIIAARGVCRILYEHWPTVPAHWRHQWLQTLVQDLSMDSSSVEVRRSVYEHMSKLVRIKQGLVYMSTLLPLLHSNIHDKSERVRRSFFDLLLNVKRVRQRDVWSIVPVKHLLARLEVEGREVGRQLVKLMWSNVFVPNQSEEERVRRFKTLAEKSLKAIRNFFCYSEHVLQFSGAVSLVTCLLRHLCTFRLGDKENVCGGKVEPWSAQVVRGLVDVVCILWTLHRKQLDRPANRRHLNQLHKLVVSCYPGLRRYYKKHDPEVLSSVLYLGSLVSDQDYGAECSTTKFCLNHLRSVTLGGDVRHKCLMWVTPLCNWGRTGELLGLVMEWLDEAFSLEDLNIFNTSCKDKKKIDFHSRDCKPLLALHVLDAMFCRVANQKVVLTTRRDLVLQLWLYLERVKVVIERCLCPPHDGLQLDNQFLPLCLHRHAVLTILLGKSQSDTDLESCDAVQHLQDLLSWSSRELLPHVDTCPAVVSMLQDMTTVAAEAVAVGLTNDVLNNMAVHFATSLLQSGRALMFVDVSSCLTHNLVQYCQAYHGRADRDRLLRDAVPQLVRGVLTALATGDNDLTQDLRCVRVMLSEVLGLGVRYYSGRCKLVCGIVTSSIDAVVAVTKISVVPQVEDLTPARGLRDLPCVAAELLGVFLKRDVFAVLFACFLKKQIRTRYSQDPLALLSAIQVLHALVHNPGLLPKQDLKKAAHTAAAALRTVRERTVCEAGASMLDAITNKLAGSGCATIT